MNAGTESRGCPWRDVRCSADCASWLVAPGPFQTHCLILESWASTAASHRKLTDVFGGLSAELAAMAPGLAGKFLKALVVGKHKPDPPAGGES